MIASEIALKPKHIKSSSGREPINMQRRAFIVGGAVAALLASSRRAMADFEHAPNDPFIVLLHGIYQPVPVGQGPADNLGLTKVNLSDGSFSKTQIYPIYGVDGANDQKKVIGTFFTQASFANGEITVNGSDCAYDLPGGALAMQFLPPPTGAPAGFDGFVPFSDGTATGHFLEGTFELSIIEARGVYQAFEGVPGQPGHNHMVDRLHQLDDGQFNASAISARISSRKRNRRSKDTVVRAAFL